MMNIAEMLMVVFSVIGSLLNMRRNKFGMVAWIIADAIGIPFFIVLERFWMVGLYLFWTGTSTYGFFFWKRKEQNEKR